MSKFSEISLSIKNSLQNQNVEKMNISLIRMGNGFIKSHLLRKRYIQLLYFLFKLIRHRKKLNWKQKLKWLKGKKKKMGKQMVKTEAVKWIWQNWNWIGQGQLRRCPIKELKKIIENALETKGWQDFVYIFLVSAALVRTKKCDTDIFHHLFPTAGKNNCYIAQWILKSAKPETQQQLYKVLETLHKESYFSKFGPGCFGPQKENHSIVFTAHLWYEFTFRYRYQSTYSSTHPVLSVRQ